MITNLSKPAKPPKAVHPSEIVFGKTVTGNFFISEYKQGSWQNPRIEPVHPFVLHPAALVFHYAQSIFEGLKAFKQEDGSIALFRPELNAQRFNQSAARMCMPTVDEDLFLDAITQLTRIEQEFVPSAPGSLYLRPVMIGTEPSIGVGSSHEFIFYILALPAGPYFAEVKGGPGAVRVLICDSVVRASRGGTGAVKAGANYAVTLKKITDAKQAGCSQVLFLDSSAEQHVEEMGGMNIMFIEGETLVTPPLSDTILNGVTRDCILKIANDMGIKTREKSYSLRELREKLIDGSVTESFACGTAATITGIEGLQTEQGEVFHLAAPGRITTLLYERLQAIQYGQVSDKHGWLRVAVQAEAPVAQ